MIDLNRGRQSKKQTALLVGAGAVATGAVGIWAWRKFSRQLMVAPGWPGKTPYWSSSAKQVVGTPLDPRGDVWFTVHRGVLTEVFFPRADQPSIHRLGFLVTGPRGFFSDEMDDADHEVTYLDEGVPAYRIISRCHQRRYQIDKILFAHPCQPVVIEQVRFTALKGRLEDYHLHVFVDPHLDNRGWSNTAEVARHKGREMLFASRGGHAVGLGTSTHWRKASAGFYGTSDGLRQLRKYGQLRQVYRRAPRGHVSLIGEIDCRQTDGVFVLAAGFGESRDEAGHRVQESLLADIDALRAQYIGQWQNWQSRFTPPQRPVAEHLAAGAQAEGRDLYRTSTMVLRAHEDKLVPGAFVASLSIPWGEARKTNDAFGPVGYHVVWPRDLFMIGGGFLAAGDTAAARRALDYLQATQQERGNWTQNQAVNGKPVWTGKQLGETAMVVLLFDLLNRAGELTAADRRRYWPMIRSAVAHIIQLGPSAQEDRWEDAAGFTPFTLACIISSFLVAAELADEQGALHEAKYLRETADAWCASIEYWTYVRDTKLAHRVGVPGYYLRVAPLDHDGTPDKYRGYAEFWYRPLAYKDSTSPADVVSPDALAYVRFGLRAPDDPRILDTLKVIDETLRIETPRGPCWYRYIGDGYGEQRDGSPFNGKRGIGRLWPLLTGERAHYELIAGHHDEAARLLTAMERLAGDGGMIPEQVWDTQDMPERGLYFGRPAGSAMPLAWAHAEYIKLRRSLAEGHAYDMPELNRQRYLIEGVESPHVIWGLNHRRPTMPPGKILRVQTDSPTRVTWRLDGKPGGSSATTDSRLGVHYIDLPTADLPEGTAISIHFDSVKGKWINKKEWFVTKSDTVRIEAERKAEAEAAKAGHA